MTRSLGDLAEKKARDFLTAQGLRWVTSNYHTKIGEIDLIMKDQNVLVFVEVRLRQNPSFGGPFESVTIKKQQKIIKTAQYYMIMNGFNESKTLYRFDIVGMMALQTPPIWIQNAFGENF